MSTQSTLKHLDLFSGIGGFALAARWAGIETVAFCEIDPFCQKVLNKHWPDIPVYSDIKNLMVDGNNENQAIGETETHGEGIDILTAGFP